MLVKAGGGGVKRGGDRDHTLENSNKHFVVVF